MVSWATNVCSAHSNDSNKSIGKSIPRIGNVQWDKGHPLIPFPV